MNNERMDFCDHPLECADLGSAGRVTSVCSGSGSGQNPLDVSPFPTDGCNSDLPGSAVIGDFLIDDCLAAGVSLPTCEELDLLDVSAEAANGEYQASTSSRQRGILVHAADIPSHPVYGVSIGVGNEIRHTGSGVEWDVQRVVKVGIFGR